jgi:hypothetical protein
MTTTKQQFLEASATAEAHRIMVRRIIEEGSFEAIMDLVCAEAAQRSGLNSTKPTLKQNRYRRIGPALVLALTSCVAGRV